MKRELVTVALLATGLVAERALLAQSRTSSAPKQYVFFARDHSRVRDSTFAANRSIAGAQLKYSWRELEPTRDHYDVSRILADLATLDAQGKRLFIQLQDNAFSEQTKFLPDYLLSDTAFHGGFARQYEGELASDADARFAGLVARRWDPAVLDRFAKLMSALGRELDGRIEGLAISETSVGFGQSGNYFPLGFSPASYEAGVKAMMSSAKAAFPRSHIIVYANFMPGAGNPEAALTHLRAIYAHAERAGVGVGGPDILPNRPFQRAHSLALIAARGPNVIAGMAVQDGNLADKVRTGPRAGQVITVGELVRYATDTLRLNYIFWGTEEPYYSRDVLPFLSRQAGAVRR